MARGEQLAPPIFDPKRAAKEAGFSKPVTLSDVDRRRTELWGASIFVVVAVTVAIALFAIGPDLLPESLRFDVNLSSWIVAVLVGGLALAFLVYVIEKERNLRKLSTLLVEERVLSAALSNRLTEISRLSELGKAVNTTLDPEDVLDMIIASALELLGGTEGSIMLLDEEEKNLVVVSYEGPRYDAVMGGRTPMGQPVAGIVAERRTPVLIQGDDLSALNPNLQVPDKRIFSSLCVPLLSQGQLLGVLNLNEREGRKAFNEFDLDALGFFAEHAAIAIRNARLYEQERLNVEQLQELDRLKSDFVATISHELKTPLTAIIGAAKTVGRKGTAMDPEQHAAFMDMISRQGNRLMRLIEDVLIASRLDSGVRHFRRELLDLRLLAEEVLEDTAAASADRVGDVVLQTEPERPRAWGDMTATVQIMTNLIDNALKYSDAGSKVMVTITESPDEAIIEVADHGVGIPSEIMGSIFERFRQADSSSTRPVGGVGLGLYIVKNLVDNQGGTISVDSEPGAGTTFTVHLPKRGEDRGGMLKAPDEAPSASS